MFISLRRGYCLEQFLKSVKRFSDKNCGKNKELEQLGEPSETKTERENSNMMSGKIELDESYFGGHRKGKRGRGAGQERLPRFGLLQKQGKVYAIPNARPSTLLPIINEISKTRFSCLHRQLCLL